MNDAAVEARGLEKRFGELVAVGGIDLRVRAGTCLGLLGPNGAGKTTTIEILEGLQRADAGSVQILGHDASDGMDAIREQIGVQLQETRLPEKLTCHEVLRMFRSFYRDGRDPIEVLEQVNLAAKRDARVGTLSGGQHQRLTLGCALVCRPRLLFLDEPTTGLDPQARRRVWEIVEAFKAAGGSVLLTTHYMDEAEKLADDLVILDHGKVIAEGAPEDIIASLGVDSVIEVKPEEADLQTLCETLRQVDGVVAADVEEDVLRLTAREVAHTLTGVFARLEADGCRLSDLRTHRPNLEDVFVTLTGRHLRDE